MNPYLQFAIAMCLIVLLSLIGTAGLAARFNRGAKRDLADALGPLADLIEGEADTEEAVVKGRYAGHLVEGRVGSNPNGPGRAFLTDVIDPAGGAPWEVVSWPTRDPALPPDRAFHASDPGLAERLAVDWEASVRPVLDPDQERYRIDYDPAAGRLRLARPMRTRRDIPAPDVFRRQLDLLVALGPGNRKAQGAPDADFAGGRRPAAPGLDGPA